MTGLVFRRSAILLATALALSPPMHAQSGYELFQQALSKERAEGKLQEAIALYQRVIDVANADHALAARALLQLGRCYEALGNAEARAAYERLIARYPDQSDLVAQARARLAALVRTPAPPSTTPSMSVRALPEFGAEAPNGPRSVLAISPDGATAAVLDLSKGQNIGLYEFAKKQMRFLTDIDWLKGFMAFAVWSPDARRVAYTHDRFGDAALHIATIDGRSSAVYRPEGGQWVQPVGWTSDSTTLVAVIARPDKTWALGTLPATGGRFAPLRSLGWSYDYRDATPRLSPDGRFIAYLEGESGVRDVHVVSLDGRERNRITDHPADDLTPVWSPDGRHLAFTSTRLNAVSLWTVEIKDGKPIGQPVKVKDGMQSTRLIDWTERGIFYDQLTSTRDLYTAPTDPVDGRPTGSPRLIPYSRTGRNVSPVWSPDGGRLAFVSSAAAEPNRRHVVVMSSDGAQAREFLIPTTAWQYAQSPYDLRWFGNGRGLGLSGTDMRGAQALFRLTLETGEWDVIPLTAEEWNVRTEWNRDGSAYYIADSRSGYVSVLERKVNGDGERIVYRSKAFSTTSSNLRTNLVSLEFSPDRKWLAFVERKIEENYTGRPTVIVVDVETGETRTLLEQVMSLNDPWPLALVGWTATGDLVVERSGTGSAALETLLVPIDGSAPRRISIKAFPASGAREGRQPLLAKWSPTGREMVISRVSQSLETFVIEHPLAALRGTTASR